MPDFGFDDWMDAQLRNVPVPRDLHARLRSALPAPDADGSQNAPVDSNPDDTRLDALLKNVEVPIDLHRRLRRIPRGRFLPLTFSDLPRGAWAAAASVLVMAGVGTFLALRQGPTSAPVAQVVKPGASPSVNAPAEKAVAESSAKRRQPIKPGTSQRQTPLTVALGDPSKSPSGQLMRDVGDVGAALRKAIEAQQAGRMALGAGAPLEPLPSLQTLEPPGARGIAPPRSRGYDLLFQLRRGEHPFVQLAADPSLAQSRVPLSFSTESYDRSQADLAAGKLPPAETIRVEDFLAAQRYALPAPPAQGMAVHTAGCPTPGSEPGKHLLQVAVQAADFAPIDRPPTRLIALVDTSAAMTAGARAKLVLRALARLGEGMLPNDRLTLIGFANAPRVLLDNVGREHLAVLGASDGLESSGGSADLLSAIEAASSAVAALPPSEARRVVFISGDGRLPASQREAARAALEKITAGGSTWHLVQVTTKPGESSWQELAQSARGRASVASSADQLSALCLESLTGRPSQVAQAVAAKIQFNPRVVASYRLIGHEAETLTGNSSVPQTVDLYAGQVGTCLFEIWLKPDAKEELGSVEVTWQHPAAGQPQRQVQPLRRADLANSFAESPLWLQQGIVAARTAEHLRGGYFVPNTRRLAQVLKLASRVDASPQAGSEFRALVRLIQQADRLR